MFDQNFWQIAQLEYRLIITQCGIKTSDNGHSGTNWDLSDSIVVNILNFSDFLE